MRINVIRFSQIIYAIVTSFLMEYALSYPSSWPTEASYLKTLHVQKCIVMNTNLFELSETYTSLVYHQHHHPPHRYCCHANQSNQLNQYCYHCVQLLL